MDFFWNVGKVEDFDKVCLEPRDPKAPDGAERALTETTSRIIAATIGNGIGEITAENFAEFYARWLIRNKGDDLAVSLDDVRKHIGLWTSTSNASLEDWLRNLKGLPTEFWQQAGELRHTLGEPERRVESDANEIVTRAGHVLRLAAFVLFGQNRLFDRLVGLHLDGNEAAVAAELDAEVALLRQRLADLAGEIGSMDRELAKSWEEMMVAAREKVLQIKGGA